MILLPSIENFLNSGSKNMSVNGSSINVVFSYSPGSGTVAIQKINCLLNDPGSTLFNKFGSSSALTNGIIISTTISGITTTITNIKDNADLVIRFNNSNFGSSASDTLGGAVGFGESHDAFIGFIEFLRPIILTDSDSIQVTIRDNLSGISTFEMACSILKEI